MRLTLAGRFLLNAHTRGRTAGREGELGGRKEGARREGGGRKEEESSRELMNVASGGKTE